MGGVGEGVGGGEVRHRREMGGVCEAPGHHVEGREPLQGEEGALPLHLAPPHQLLHLLRARENQVKPTLAASPLHPHWREVAEVMEEGGGGEGGGVRAPPQEHLGGAEGR